MICYLCGKELPDGALYCDGCGNTFAALDERAPEEDAQAAPETAEAGEETAEPQAEAPAVEPLDEAAESEYANIRAADGTFPDVAEPARKINSHMVLAVMTTVLLFNWTLGIPAVIFARECELAAEKGQFEIAERFSRRAMNFALVGVGLTLAFAAFAALIITVIRAAGPALLY